MKKERLSPPIIGLLEATGLAAYLALFAAFLNNANNWFGSLANRGFLGPMLALAIFALSAIVCVAVMGGYPFYILWEKKNTKLAFTIGFYSTFWLFIFIILTLLVFTILR